MARTTVVPLNSIDRRAPEAGRIRIGVKTGRAMKSIDTFRFTSPYQDIIEQLAARYGGQAQPWTDERARIRDQWEVITPVNEIPVYLPANGLSVNYEKWSGGGCERRCDGEQCEIVQMQGDNAVPVATPCICVAKSARECQPYTRLNVVLPELPFRGTWRLETKGWNALHELPGMWEMIRSLDESGRMVQAYLGVEKRSDKAAGKTRHYVVPKLTVGQSPQELQSGVGSVTAIGESTVASLPAVTLTPVSEQVIWDIAEDWGIDYDALKDNVISIVGSDQDRILKMQEKINAGALVPAEKDGEISWIRK